MILYFQVACKCKIAFHTHDMKHVMYLQWINGRSSAKIHSKAIKQQKEKLTDFYCCLSKMDFKIKIMSLNCYFVSNLKNSNYYDHIFTVGSHGIT